MSSTEDEKRAAEIRAAADNPKDANDVLQRDGTAGVRAMIEGKQPAQVPKGSGKAAKKGGGKKSGGGKGSDGNGSDGGEDRPYLERNFEHRPSGLWYIGGHEPVFVCSKIEARAKTRDKNSENWGVLLAFPDDDRKEHVWAMPRSMLAGDGNSIREYLHRHGAHLTTSKAGRDALMNWLTSVAPKESALCVEQVGWHAGKGGFAFVLPDEVYGPQGEERMILQQVSATTHNFEVAGDLRDWQREVAALCTGNSRLVLAIATAFAAPLLQLVGEESGGINFLGQSRTGKSTAVFVASSVWGRGARGGYVRQWRSTANGLESVAAAHSDTMLALDEMGQMDPREIGEAAYMLANESGKSRASRDGSARYTATWRVLILSSGENSIGELTQEGGRRAKVGQEVRIVDVPADTGSGLGIFEDLHDGMYEATDEELQADPRSRSATADAFSRRLREAAGKYYGTPCRAYLTALADLVARDRDGLLGFIKEHTAAFINSTVPKEATGQVRSVAGRFALISAAGELATRFEVTGWEVGVARQAAGLCFAAWREGRGTMGAKEDELAIEAVRTFIEAHGNARFQSLEATERPDLDPGAKPTDPKTIQRAGWKQWNANDECWDYLVTPGVWKKEVVAGRRGAAKALVDRGYLLPDSGGKHARTVRIPGYKVVRVYHVRGAIMGDSAGLGDD